MSHHLHPDPHNSTGVFYWILWASLFIFTKISGFISWVAAAISFDKVVLPEHHNRFLPELSEMIPQIIVACVLAVFSFLTIELMKFIKQKISK